jgi:hypothetical protein
VGIFLQRLAIAGNGLLEPRRAALPLAETKERIAEIDPGYWPNHGEKRFGVGSLG